MRATALLLVTSVVSVPAAAQERVGMLEPISVSEFLKLPDAFQTIYVAGALGGLAYMAYSYSGDQYPIWVKCVSQQSLGKTKEDVVAFLRENPKFEESVVTALAMALARRCKK